MFSNWVIFVDRGVFQNAGSGSGERAEPALRRPWPYYQRNSRIHCFTRCYARTYSTHLYSYMRVTTTRLI